MSEKKFRISTDDYLRVLLTETLPYEVPLIYSNEGLYEFYKYSLKNEDNVPKLLRNLLALNECGVPPKIPFQYRICKDIDSTRSLYLVHPAVQYQFVDFYKRYDSLITYYCSKSEFSLRFPKKVAGAVYQIKNIDTYNLLSEEQQVFKTDQIELEDEEKRNKFSSNYFAYKKVNVLYKFFESPEFIRLEKKFTRMISLDVSRCFDTIYTHSISWAVKDKRYIKQNLRGSDEMSFDNDFDCLIRKTNDNETNGIVIGPEFSRIFSEIIFQQIDENIFSELLALGLTHNRDYAIRRYIDDYFVFAKDHETEQKVKSSIIDHLWGYKFRINPAKTREYSRPFTTERSRNVIELRSKLESKFNNLVDKKENDEGKKYWIPKNLSKPLLTSTAFIKDIKSCWHTTENLEAGFSNYVLSSLLRTYLNIIRFRDRVPNGLDGNAMANFSIFLLDVAHYCFALRPKVSESYKFCQLIIVMNRFIRFYFQSYSDKLNHKIHESLMMLLRNELSDNVVCGVEKFNVLLTLASVNDKYLPDSETLEELIFDKDHEMNYFNVIVALYVAKDDKRLTDLRDRSIQVAKKLFESNAGIHYCTESMHLYLDLMSCPFLTNSEKKAFSISAVTQLLDDHTLKEKPSKKQVSNLANEMMKFCKDRIWFVNWKDMDLLLSLQRKLLKESY